MHIRGIALILLALSFAGGTAYMVRGWLTTQQVNYRNQVAAEYKNRPAQAVAKANFTSRVLVAAEPLNAGTILQEQHMKWQPWPTEGLSDQYFVQQEGVIEDMMGQVIRSATVAGEPILKNRLVKKGDRGFLAAVLQPGKRAISVPVSASSGVAGLIFPGDRVDLITTFPAQTLNQLGQPIDPSSPIMVSQTVLSGVRIIALDQRTAAPDAPTGLAKTATLEVSPKEAEKVTLAQLVGSMSMALHSLTNGEEPAPSAAEVLQSYTVQDEISPLLIGLEVAKPAAAPTAPIKEENYTVETFAPLPAASRTVTVMRGDQQSDLNFAR